jgi:hypothetical protein
MPLNPIAETKNPASEASGNKPFGRPSQANPMQKPIKRVISRPSSTRASGREGRYVTAQARKIGGRRGVITILSVAAIIAMLCLDVLCFVIAGRSGDKGLQLWVTGGVFICYHAALITGICCQRGGDKTVGFSLAKVEGRGGRRHSQFPKSIATKRKAGNELRGLILIAIAQVFCFYGYEDVIVQANLHSVVEYMIRILAAALPLLVFYVAKEESDERLDPVGDLSDAIDLFLMMSLAEEQGVKFPDYWRTGILVLSIVGFFMAVLQMNVGQDTTKNSKENRRDVAGAVFCKCLVEISFLFTRIIASATYGVPVGIMAIKNTFAIVINIQDLFNDQPLDGISVQEAAQVGVDLR